MGIHGLSSHGSPVIVQKIVVSKAHPTTAESRWRGFRTVESTVRHFKIDVDSLLVSRLKQRRRHSFVYVTKHSFLRTRVPEVHIFPCNVVHIEFCLIGRCPNTQREQVEILQGDILRVRESERVLKSTTPEFECRWFDVIRSDDFDELLHWIIRPF